MAKKMKKIQGNQKKQSKEINLAIRKRQNDPHTMKVVLVTIIAVTAFIILTNSI